MKTYQDTVKEIELDEETQKTLRNIELGVLTKVTLADAIRGGSKHTEQALGWGNGVQNACALTAAAQWAEATGYL